MALTAAAVKGAKPHDKPRRLYDERGLYLEVSPKGGKWWRLKYRLEGREKRISLGVYPDVELKDARHLRDQARRLLAKGIDPSARKKAEKAARRKSCSDSFENVAREWHATRASVWSPKHAATVLRRLEANVFPWMGSRQISEVRGPELLAIVRRIEARGAIETAHRVLSICGQVFRYAVATGRAERDIAPDLRGALSPVNTTHLAAVLEPQRAGELLRSIHGYVGAPQVQCALKLAPVVFVRPGELRTALWADIDLERAEWRYEASKTKTPHIVPLSRQAVQILRELLPVSGESAYVFPSARSPRRPMSDNAVLAALRRMGIPREEMTGHGFRAMARTMLDEQLGFRPDIIEHQLGHRVRDPLGRAYNRTNHLEARREMMQAWADYLDRLREGSAESTNCSAPWRPGNAGA